jgi:biopolymer transport protein ExbD
MNMSLAPPKRKASGDDNMIPLINIVFLLLIFFMVAGQMKSFQTADLAPPVAQSDEPVVLEANRIEINSDGQIYLNGSPVSIALLATEVGGIPNVALQKVTLQADKGVVAKDLSAIIDVIHKYGIATIHLYTESAEDSQ